jgi:hypothetical protein
MALVLKLYVEVIELTTSKLNQHIFAREPGGGNINNSMLESRN